MKLAKLVRQLRVSSTLRGSTLVGSLITPISNSHFHGDDVDQKITTVDRFLRTYDKSFRIDMQSFRNSIEHEKFNPHREYPADSYYVPTDSLSRLDEIFDDIEDPELRENTLLVGEKGSGKTLTQNIWLKRNHKKLEEMKIFWYRCDFRVLYDCWLNLFNQTHRGRIYLDSFQDHRITMDTYLKLQMLYVFSKNCRDTNRPFFNNAYKKLQGSGIELEIPPTGDINGPKKELWKWVVDISEKITNHENNLEKGYSYLADDIFSRRHDFSQHEINQWKKISNALRVWLTSYG